MRPAKLVLALALATGSCRNAPDAIAPPSDKASASASTPLAPASVSSPSASRGRGTAIHETTALPAAPAPLHAWPPTPPQVESDFCIDGVPALDEETCYVLPEAPTRELLLYLHGIVPPEKTSRQKTNFETVVQNASRRAGVAALMPRGELGLAPKGHANWWGWPTTAAAHRKWSPKLVAKLADKRRKLEELVKQPFTRLYVAGSSSGAYYAIELGLSGDLPGDGFAALSGATRTNRDLSRLTPRPFYIGYGSLDSVGAAAQALGGALRKAGWPVLVKEHRLPHGTAEIYLDEAFAFWRGHLTAGSK